MHEDQSFNRPRQRGTIPSTYNFNRKKIGYLIENVDVSDSVHILNTIILFRKNSSQIVSM